MVSELNLESIGNKIADNTSICDFVNLVLPSILLVKTNVKLSEKVIFYHEVGENTFWAVRNRNLLCFAIKTKETVTFASCENGDNDLILFNHIMEKVEQNGIQSLMYWFLQKSHIFTDNQFVAIGSNIMPSALSNFHNIVSAFGFALIEMNRMYKVYEEHETAQTDLPYYQLHDTLGKPHCTKEGKRFEVRKYTPKENKTEFLKELPNEIRVILARMGYTLK